MKPFIGLLSLAVLGLGAPKTSAQAVVKAPILETQNGHIEALNLEAKKLSADANQIATKGVEEQNLTKVFSEKNMLMAKTWYDGLVSVSKAVRDYRRVQVIFQKQTQIISQYSSTIAVLRKSPFVTIAQLSSIQATYAKLLAESASSISDLTTVISPAVFKMTDAERMKFIDRLDDKVTAQAGLINYFSERNLLMMHTEQQKAQDQKSVQALMVQ